MIRLLRKNIPSLCFIFFILFLIIGSFDSVIDASTIKQNDELIERIAKDFSNKFCNGIGFGLSEESAMNFAMKENMATFKNKKGLESIDNKLIVEKISLSVLNKCGFELNLSEYEWGK